MTTISYKNYQNTNMRSMAQHKRFRKAVNDIAKAKVRLFVQQAMEVVKQGIASGNVPASQILDGTSTTLKNFKSVANKVSRRCGGGQVVFLADPELIDY